MNSAKEISWNPVWHMNIYGCMTVLIDVKIRNEQHFVIFSDLQCDIINSNL